MVVGWGGCWSAEQRRPELETETGGRSACSPSLSTTPTTHILSRERREEAGA